MKNLTIMPKGVNLKIYSIEWDMNMITYLIGKNLELNKTKKDP